MIKCVNCTKAIVLIICDSVMHVITPKLLDIIVLRHFSATPLEASHPVYDKVNRRLEHLSKLKTNTSKYESESIMVSAHPFYCRL